MILLDQDRIEELEQRLDEWLRRGQQELTPDEKALGTTVLVDTSLAREKPAQAAALLRTIPSTIRPSLSLELHLAESQIAVLQKKPKAAVQLANQALRESTHAFNSNAYQRARIQLARAYMAAGEPAQARPLLDALQAEATREGLRALELELRLVRSDDSPTGHSHHHEELKQLEADATRKGFLLIARQAREAAAR